MPALLDQLEARQQSVTAVVLAGGLARRMDGIDKGLITLGERPMASWVAEAISPKVHHVLINANRNVEKYEAIGSPFNAAVVSDKHTGHIGPLAGLSAALHQSHADFVFMCPCDSPFIDADIIDRLGEHCLVNDADIAVAHDGARMQPVFCFVNRRCLSSLDQYLESGERKIDRWYAQLNTVEVDCKDLAISFQNINTEEERLNAERELIT